jgi:branched-chain amino acid transport system substrate-binding protein
VIVGTVSSGATATLQGIAAESQIPLIVAPAAANDITGANFNEYTFRTSRSNYQDAMNLCEYLPTQYKHLRADRAGLQLRLGQRGGLPRFLHAQRR